jgi:hypothetical protein
MTVLSSIVAAALAVGLGGCGHNTRYDFPTPAGVATSEPQGGVRARVDWVKLKGDTVDALLFLENAYPHPVVIKPNAVRLFYLERSGTLPKSVSPIEIHPGQTIRLLVIREFDPPVPDEGGRVTIEADGITRGTLAREEGPLPPVVLRLSLGEYYQD